MKQFGKLAVCLLLLLALCACSHAAGLKGTWQGDGSPKLGIEGPDEPLPFEGAERWTFDGEDTAVATVNGREIEFHYEASDDTLTLNDGGEMSWGVLYERKGDVLRIGEAEFAKID